MKRLIYKISVALIVFFTVAPGAVIAAEDPGGNPPQPNPNAKVNVINPKLCNDLPVNEKPIVCEENYDQGPDKENGNRIYGPNGTLTKVANILALVVGVAAVIVIIIAGFQYVLSSGDSAKVNTAKNMIIYAIGGLLVTVFARAIIIFVVSRL